MSKKIDDAAKESAALDKLFQEKSHEQFLRMIGSKEGQAPTGDLTRFLSHRKKLLDELGKHIARKNNRAELEYHAVLNRIRKQPAAPSPTDLSILQTYLSRSSDADHEYHLPKYEKRLQRALEEIGGLAASVSQSPLGN